MENKRAAVRYFSKSGRTKQVAEAIAEAAGCTAEPIPAPLDEPVDILFLGAPVYWGSVDASVFEYIRSLNKDLVGEAVIFSTSGLAERAFPQIRKALQEQGIRVDDENFHCPGQFAAMHRGHPDRADLERAGQFAKRILETGAAQKT